MVKRTAAGKGRKRPRKAEEASADDDAAGFFLLDDADKQHGEEEEEEQQQQETAEQKRIRLARAYLDELRAAAAGSGGGTDDDDEDEGSEGGGGRARARRDAAAAAAAAAGDAELAERLRLEALDAQGRLQRKLAHRVLLPSPEQQQQQAQQAQRPQGSRRAERYGAGRFCRAHRLSPTAVALSEDGRTAFSVAKDGSILRWDVETMQRTELVRPGSKAAVALAAAASSSGTTADWVKRAPRASPTCSLLAAALSSDGRYLAVGGGDRAVHIFDASGSGGGGGVHVAAYPGHRDDVTGLAFRPGTHQLYSASADRTVKVWSIDDAAYVDTLFGHQAEVFAVAAARAERVVSTGHDHTCRFWKVPEESHLVFRSPSMAQYAVALLTGSEWVSGGSDGSLQVWNTLKKKPVSITRNAHTAAAAAAAAAAGQAEAHEHQQQQLEQEQEQPPQPQPPAAGSWATANVDTPAWIQSLAVAPGSDLLASGAGDGFVRLWQVAPSKHGGAGSLKQVGELPAAGYVNGLALDRTGTVCVAAVGQEPRLGRWGRAAGARNGLLVHRWQLAEEVEEDD